jgi:hypothetical protein
VGVDYHKKYAELLELRPRIVWIVGPEAFAVADPEHVFRVDKSSGTIVRMRPMGASELTFSNP